MVIYVTNVIVGFDKEALERFTRYYILSVIQGAFSFITEQLVLVHVLQT